MIRMIRCITLPKRTPKAALFRVRPTGIPSGANHAIVVDAIVRVKPKAEIEIVRAVVAQALVAEVPVAETEKGVLVAMDVAVAVTIDSDVAIAIVGAIVAETEGVVAAVAGDASTKPADDVSLSKRDS